MARLAESSGVIVVKVYPTSRCTGLPKQRLIEGVSPAKLVEIEGNNAGKVGVESKGCLYSGLAFRLSFRRAASELKRWVDKG